MIPYFQSNLDGVITAWNYHFLVFEHLKLLHKFFLKMEPNNFLKSVINEYLSWGNLSAISTQRTAAFDFQNTAHALDAEPVTTF
jgi:hypothetical protein